MRDDELLIFGTIQDPCIRTVHQIKNSLGPTGGTFSFEIRSETGFKWLDCSLAPESQATPEKHNEQTEFSTKMEKAAYLIRELLADEDMLSIEIAEILTDLKRETKIGNTVWNAKSVLGILQNERHCGDIISWKTYTYDYLEHKSRKNHGKRPRIRQVDHHEVIHYQLLKWWTPVPCVALCL